MAFIPKLDVLPNSQQSLWKELIELSPEFVLYGGTTIDTLVLFDFVECSMPSHLPQTPSNKLPVVRVAALKRHRRKTREFQQVPDTISFSLFEAKRDRSA